MKKEILTKILGELAEVVKFHELDTVDSKAAELLAQLEDIEADDDDEVAMTDFIEVIRQANMVKTAR